MSKPVLRSETLRCYKHLLKTINKIFHDDNDAIRLTQQKAREEFRKKSHLQNPDEIRESIQIGYDSAEILRRTVIQARLNERGNYEAKIRTENIDGSEKG
ncbi:hypothetical protein BLA29_001549 [Euroglyphus maynei]|uniref:Complex III assembly factor LYRM7 n=1 Tax=Euroglyphus maynei TaxID=6958 RepID=A0A1Y3AMF8_EURMA|nr:hypothetical protein BLA29_001549 [Euroglyphus maynei]